MKNLVLSSILFLTVSSITIFGQNTYPWPATGNIGIGTSSTPRSILDIAGKVVIGTSSPTTGSGLELYHHTPTNTSYVTSYNRDSHTYLPLYLSGSVFYFNYGKVGIGTTEPSDKLHVVGTTYLDGDVKISKDHWITLGGTNSSGKLAFAWSETYKMALIDYRYNLYFRNSINSPLILQSNGSVAIGFSPNYSVPNFDHAQGYKLTVNGGILCEEIKVVTSVPESDYVFEKDYNLKSLSEVEAFVKENKHLPEVPSAEEFKRDGYKVGEMDDLLLRKVEELTLYTIEQQKMLEEQGRKIKELEEMLLKKD